MIINFNSITKYYGSNKILDNVSGIIKSKSRIGIIGANGAGKTTLFKILTSEIEYEQGELFINSNVKIGYLHQNSLVESNNTVFDEMNSVFAKEHAAIEKLSKLDINNLNEKSEYERLYSFITARDAYNTETKIKYVLNGLDFKEDTYTKPVNVLSGGEKTRLALAKLLLTDCNVLLLDEPTNHLDFKTCSWLEEYLKSFNGAVISITHDRYYLNSVCDTIWEVEFGKISEYVGNYNQYKLLKQQKLEYQQKLYDEYVEKQQKLKDYIAKNLVRASTSAMAKSRRRDLEKMEEVLPPSEYNKKINLKFTFDKKSWFDVLKVNDLSVKINNNILFSNLNLDIKQKQKIAIIGENGIGKTTLFKVLLGIHNNFDGKFKWGNDVTIGVFDQNKIFEDSSKTVIDELWDNYKNLTENQIRTALATMLFTGDDVFKKISEISGGESARLQFANLSLAKNNTLMFDEPTNHLDMSSKESLEQALLHFDGTEIIISHDRYFLNTVPDIIVYLSKEKVVVFEGKFDEFMQKLEKAPSPSQKPQKQQKQHAGYTTKEQRANAAKKRNEISALESKINLLEQEIASLEQQIEQNSKDFVKLEEYCNKLEQKKMELDEISEKWLVLSE